MKEYEVINVDTGRIFHLIMDSLDSLFTFIYTVLVNTDSKNRLDFDIE